jgi:hypothetical protein
MANAVLKNPDGVQRISGFGLIIPSLQVNGNMAVIGSMTKENLVVVAFSNTANFDGSLGTCFEMTLTGNVGAPTLANITGGVLYTFILIQDGAGARTFTWPAAVKNPSVINAVENSISVQTFKARNNGNLYPINPMTYN